MNLPARQRVPALALGAVLFLAAGAALGYWFAHHAGLSEKSTETSAATDGGRKPLYWYDPMVPSQHFDKPGKSPFMDMQLVPKYSGDSANNGSTPESGLRIGSRLVQNLGLRTTVAQKGPLARDLDAVGTIGFNQREVAVVQARTNGFVNRVYARAAGDVIPLNAPIVDLLVPEWAGAQSEYLALLASGDRSLIDAARQRLLLLGMPTDLISRVEKGGKPETVVTVRSPLAGAIEAVDVREGMTVAAGATLAKIDGLSTVWLEAAVPESSGPVARSGNSVEVRVAGISVPSKGRVIAILPQANADTRTVRVRIEIPNPDGRLRPGLFATVTLAQADETPVVYVASEAIIRTGRRAVAIAVANDGGFVSKEVRIGADVGTNTVVLQGLSEGERVVASGQFLIDSEASLRGVLVRLGADEPNDPGSRTQP